MNKMAPIHPGEVLLDEMDKIGDRSTRRSRRWRRPEQGRTGTVYPEGR